MKVTLWRGSLKFVYILLEICCIRTVYHLDVLLMEIESRMLHRCIRRRCGWMLVSRHVCVLRVCCCVHVYVHHRHHSPSGGSRVIRWGEGVKRRSGKRVSPTLWGLGAWEGAPSQKKTHAETVRFGACFCHVAILYIFVILERRHSPRKITCRKGSLWYIFCLQPCAFLLFLNTALEAIALIPLWICHCTVRRQLWFILWL